MRLELETVEIKKKKKKKQNHPLKKCYRKDIALGRNLKLHTSADDRSTL